MARSLVVVVAVAVGPSNATAVERSVAAAAGSFAEGPLWAPDWANAAAAVDVVVAAMAVGPDRLLPVVGRERKSTAPDVGRRRGTMPAIFVSRWWHDQWGEAIRSAAVAPAVRVAAVPAVSGAAAAGQGSLAFR